MDEETSPYDSCGEDVQLLVRNPLKAYEQAKDLPGNDNTVARWNILLDTKGGLLIGSLNEWKSKGQLNPDYIGIKKDLVSEGLDAIIRLESCKKKK